MGEWTGRLAQHETAVLEVHEQLTAVIRATDEHALHQQQAPILRMLDRANDYMNKLNATRTRESDLEDGSWIGQARLEAERRRSRRSGRFSTAHQAASMKGTTQACDGCSLPLTLPVRCAGCLRQVVQGLWCGTWSAN